MRNIKGVIFSRDRAMQLHAMLRSLFLHCSEVENTEFWVLYKTSGDRHEKQYQQLIEEYAGSVVFMRQQDFRRDLLMYLNPFADRSFAGFIFSFLSTLGSFGPPLGSFPNQIWRRTVHPVLIFLSGLLLASVQEDNYVFFLVDDNIFVRDFTLDKPVETLKQIEKLLGFSLRLGRNTIYCYTRERKQTLPEMKILDQNIAIFDWTSADGDFGYPLEVSSSIYRLRDILPLLMAVSFDNPNTLEDRMAFHARRFRKMRPSLASYERSVTFCNPINLVQSVMLNRAGDSRLYGADELASRFERQERIQVEAYSGFVPQACHQEVELIFEKYE